MVKINSNQKGTTLTELMIAVALMGVVLTVAPPLITNILKFSRVTDARIDTQKNARLSLSQINRHLRQALASSVIISQETGQPPCSAVEFNTVDGRWVKYYQDDEDLMFVQDGSTRTLAQSLRYIAFTPPKTDDSKIVSVSVTFEKATYQGDTKALQMAVEKVRIMND